MSQASSFAQMNIKQPRNMFIELYCIGTGFWVWLMTSFVALKAVYFTTPRRGILCEVYSESSGRCFSAL